MLSGQSGLDSPAESARVTSAPHQSWKTTRANLRTGMAPAVDCASLARPPTTAASHSGSDQRLTLSPHQSRLQFAAHAGEKSAPCETQSEPPRCSSYIAAGPACWSSSPSRSWRERSAYLLPKHPCWRLAIDDDAVKRLRHCYGDVRSRRCNRFMLQRWLRLSV
jgi:hypothetical protein